MKNAHSKALNHVSNHENAHLNHNAIPLQAHQKE